MRSQGDNNHFHPLRSGGAPERPQLSVEVGSPTHGAHLASVAALGSLGVGSGAEPPLSLHNPLRRHSAAVQLSPLPAGIPHPNISSLADSFDTNPFASAHSFAAPPSVLSVSERGTDLLSGTLPLGGTHPFASHEVRVWRESEHDDDAPAAAEEDTAESKRSVQSGSGGARSDGSGSSSLAANLQPSPPQLRGSQARPFVGVADRSSSLSPSQEDAAERILRLVPELNSDDVASCLTMRKKVADVLSKVAADLKGEKLQHLSMKERLYYVRFGYLDRHVARAHLMLAWFDYLLAHAQDDNALFGVLCHNWLQLSGSEERHLSSGSTVTVADMQRHAAEVMRMSQEEVDRVVGGGRQKRCIREWDLVCAPETGIRRMPDAACVVDFIESMSCDDLIELELMHNAILRRVDEASIEKQKQGWLQRTRSSVTPTKSPTVSPSKSQLKWRSALHVIREDRRMEQVTAKNGTIALWQWLFFFCAGAPEFPPDHAAFLIPGAEEMVLSQASNLRLGGWAWLVYCARRTLQRTGSNTTQTSVGSPRGSMTLPPAASITFDPANLMRYIVTKSLERDYKMKSVKWKWNAFFLSLRDRLVPVSSVTIRTAQAVTRGNVRKVLQVGAVNVMRGLAVVGRTIAEGTYRLADPKQSRSSKSQQLRYLAFYLLVFVPGVWHSVSAQVREYVTLYLAWSHVPLFMTLVMSFASLDAVEDAQARFRACNRRTLQAAKVHMIGQDVSFTRRNGERVTLRGGSGPIHGWHLAACIEEVVRSKEAVQKEGLPAWIHHAGIAIVACLHAIAPWMLQLAFQEVDDTSARKQLQTAPIEVEVFLVVSSLLDCVLMSAVVLMVMKAIAAYRLWSTRMTFMSCMTDKLAASQNELPFLDLAFPSNLRTWRELRAYQSEKVVHEDKIRQLEVPLGFLLLWQLGRLVLLAVMVVSAFIERRREEGDDALIFTSQNVSVAGVVIFDVCIFGTQMSFLIWSGLHIYNEQKAQARLLIDKGVAMLELEIEQDEMLLEVRQHYGQAAGLGSTTQWQHLQDSALNQEKQRLHQSAIMLQATASALRETDEPPKLLGMPLNETFVQIVVTVAVSGVTAAASAIAQRFQNQMAI